MNIVCAADCGIDRFDDLGHEQAYSADKAIKEVGWSPRPIEDTIAECAQSLLDRGVVSA